MSAPSPSSRGPRCSADPGKSRRTQAFTLCKLPVPRPLRRPGKGNDKGKVEALGTAGSWCRSRRFTTCRKAADGSVPFAAVLGAPPTPCAISRLRPSTASSGRACAGPISSTALVRYRLVDYLARSCTATEGHGRLCRHGSRSRSAPPSPAIGAPRGDASTSRCTCRAGEEAGRVDQAGAARGSKRRCTASRGAAAPRIHPGAAPARRLPGTPSGGCETR